MACLLSGCWNGYKAINREVERQERERELREQRQELERLRKEREQEREQIRSRYSPRVPAPVPPLVRTKESVNNKTLQLTWKLMESIDSTNRLYTQNKSLMCTGNEVQAEQLASHFNNSTAGTLAGALALTITNLFKPGDADDLQNLLQILLTQRDELLEYAEEMFIDPTRAVHDVKNFKKNARLCALFNKLKAAHPNGVLNNFGLTRRFQGNPNYVSVLSAFKQNYDLTSLRSVYDKGTLALAEPVLLSLWTCSTNHNYFFKKAGSRMFSQELRFQAVLRKFMKSRCSVVPIIRFLLIHWSQLPPAFYHAVTTEVPGDLPN